MKLIKAVRGTKDIIEGTASKYSYIHRMAEDLFKSYGYSFIKTPIFEETDSSKEESEKQQTLLKKRCTLSLIKVTEA